ncbi:aromatic ring-hydroxylating dioxygenase subunit alpha [Phenylobacterium sp.]|uniref:aromatic ring-hydroxylating oxygenase subunit alpha n=1 Tax=Phenylobacterium sp. TaxID=1871053 RepID=UPI00286B3728|nr:aromatic ring-hydroxylating dioxygenase subunit alpha [Phenylobacterium sp.]
MTEVNARRLTPADYVDPDIFIAERDGLLSRGWIAVCRSDQLEGPGSQRAVEVAGRSVLVLRDLDGGVSALSNVCRHRGALLVVGEACAKTVQCPYHLWTYALDGRLTAAPFMDGVDHAGLDLPRYGAAEWCGWVLVNLSGDAPPVAERLAPLTPRFAARDLGAWKIGWELDFDSPWNWKVMVENFAESYHHIGPHAQSLQPFWPGGRSDPSASGDDWIELAHSHHPLAGTFTVYVVFPMLMFAVSEPDDMVVWYRMTPTAADRFHLTITGLFPAGADAAAIETYRAQLQAIHLEDIPICERVQAGLSSQGARLGPLSPLEEGIARFQAFVAANR